MPEQDFYFNPFDADFRANPYPHFPALLKGPPRQLNLFMPTTLIARYDDVVTVLHDHERFTVRRPEIPFRERIDPFGGAPTILTADPPVHSRLRRLVSKAFTPRRVRELEPRIREITTDLLSRATDSGEVEAMAALANPLPVIVIAEMLGVSANDHAQFKQWSNDLISSFGQEMATGPSAAGLAAKEELRRYLAEAIKQRSANPADDLISALVTARDESDALSENELLAFVVHPAGEFGGQLRQGGLRPRHRIVGGGRSGPRALELVGRRDHLVVGEARDVWFVPVSFRHGCSSRLSPAF